MSEYRTGNHWGVTIVRKGPPPDANGSYDELVAVVVNGDQGLAERICALLNEDGREPIEHEVTTIGAPYREFLGPGGTIRTAPHEDDCDCGHAGLDEMFHLQPCPIAVRRFTRRRPPAGGGLEDA